MTVYEPSESSQNFSIAKVSSSEKEEALSVKLVHEVLVKLVYEQRQKHN